MFLISKNVWGSETIPGARANSGRRRTDFCASLGDAADTVLAEARHRGCDHVFVTGRKRSPAGKAIFGDVAQRIVLEFDGAVTVLAE